MSGMIWCRWVLQANFLVKETEFLPEPVDLLSEIRGGLATVSGPIAGAGQCEVGEGDGVDDRGADAARPAFGKRQGTVGLSGHGSPLQDS
jgi:hypothetical protein